MPARSCATILAQLPTEEHVFSTLSVLFVNLRQEKQHRAALPCALERCYLKMNKCIVFKPLGIRWPLCVLVS